jgi:hypothetical protein
MIKNLELGWTKHQSKEHSDRQYLDYIVSGQPLREYLGIKNSSSVTPFGFFQDMEQQKRALKEFRLQQKTQLSGNRIELYICECCGDIGCGSITAKIIASGDKILWTNFASQTNPEEIGEEIIVEQIEFHRQAYFNAFATLG